MRFSLLIFQFIWILILLPKTIQFVITLLLIVTLVVFLNSKVKFDYISIMLLLIGFLTMLVSLVNALFFIELPISRLIAAINTGGIWVISAFYYSFFKATEVDLKKISKYCFMNIVILLIILLVMFVLKNSNLPEVTILGRSLYTTEWFEGEKTTRFNALMEYSNLIPIFICISLPFAIQYIDILKNKSRTSVIILLLASLIPVFESNSRTGIFAVTIGAISVIFYNLVKDKKYGIMYFLIFVGVIFLAFNMSYISVFVDRMSQIVNGREGSDLTRQSIYSTSINYVMSKSPIFGVGIKTFQGNYPLGSHSMFIGILYKTGIVGLILLIFMIFQIGLNLIRGIKSQKSNLAINFLIFTVALFSILVFEDFDGTNWVMPYYFSLLGVVLGQETDLKVPDTNKKRLSAT